MSDYNGNSIDNLSDVEHIRLRTSAYIPDVGDEGLTKFITEIIDNSFDECEQIGRGKISIVLMINRDRSNFTVICKDNGRGIPAEKLIDVFASARTSGKFNTDSYAYSSGTFGIGSTVVLALSKYFRAITLNPDIIADVTIPHNHIPTRTIDTQNKIDDTGTVVIFSPDDAIFIDIPKFIADYSKLIEYLIHHSLFSKYSIRLFVVNEADCDIKTMKTMPALSFIDKLIISNTAVYDSTDLDKQSYIRSYFGIQKTWNGHYTISGKNSSDTLRVQGDIFISLNGFSAAPKTKLAFVNNLLFDDNSSLHTSLMIKFIKHRVSSNITDKSVRSFFIDHYKLPIFLVLDVKFSAAQFSGFAKSSFKDLSFKHPYQSLLATMINDIIIRDMYEVLKDHIDVAFNKFSNSDFKPTTSKNILSRLNRPDKFQNCRTNNPQTAELFLVEGDSAKIKNGRNPNNQALYTLGGKPFNGLTDQQHLPESISAIKKNAVLQDIIRILNITPGSNDLSSLNFYKTFIMADADTHGYHITNIIIGDLYAICPALIESGYLYVITPPLYSISIKGSSPIYVRDSTELNVRLAYYVYSKCLDITIKSDTYNRLLTLDEFVVFCELVIKIGEMLDRISDEFMIPALVLEQLALISNLINVRVPNIDLIAQMLGCEVRYVSTGHLLIISIGSDDIIIPLHQISEIIYSRILPMYREFYYGKTQIFATTKNSQYLNNSPTSIVQLYNMFKQMNKLMKIERFKGLGSMPEADSARNCLDPQTRKVYQIKSIGDVKTIFDMLGTDPSERKRLVDLNI